MTLYSISNIGDNLEGEEEGKGKGGGGKRESMEVLQKRGEDREV